jgi:hypothetical protein
MIERDYIMRMINVLFRALESILHLKKQKDYPAALLELRQTMKILLGVDQTFIEQFSDEQLMEFFRLDDRTVAVKCYVLGILLKEAAEIHRLQNEPEQHIAISLRSLNFLMESFLDTGNPIDERHLPAIIELFEALKEYQLPVELTKKIFRYYERIGQFAAAEDVLFAVLNNDPSFAQSGVAFYERLLTKSDTELISANLPRNEVEKGLEDLHRRLQTSGE